MLRQRVINLLQSAQQHTAPAEVGHTEVDAHQAFVAAAPEPPADPVEETDPIRAGISLDMLPQSVFTPSLGDVAGLQLRSPSQTSTPESTLGNNRGEDIIVIGSRVPLQQLIQA